MLMWGDGAAFERPVFAVPSTTAAPNAMWTVSEAAELTARMATLRMKVLWSMHGAP
jgi:hypothetical protein